MDLYFLVNYLTEARSLNRNFLCRKTAKPCSMVQQGCKVNEFSTPESNVREHFARAEFTFFQRQLQESAHVFQVGEISRPASG